MTKTEISIEVFNRHASSAEIDEALRLLRGLHMVKPKPPAVRRFNAGFTQGRTAKKANKPSLPRI